MSLTKAGLPEGEVLPDLHTIRLFGFDRCSTNVTVEAATADALSLVDSSAIVCNDNSKVMSNFTITDRLTCLATAKCLNVYRRLKQ